MDATQYKQAILQTLDAIGGEVTACADAIHGYAELSGEEHRSAAALEELLEHHGFAVERGLKDLPTAFRAVYGSGPVRIGFMCEYDALAGLQQDDVPCQQGNGTPAEETLAGKTIMVNNGCFRDVDVVLGWHPHNHSEPGEIKHKAAAAFTMTFHGRAAHACNCPENGRSALDAAELTNIGVNYLREHVDRDCYMHYCYLNGGERPNIVPDYAKLWYMVRAYTYAQMKEVEQRVKRIAEGACLMTDTTVEFETLGDTHDNRLNFTLSRIVWEAMEAVGTPCFTEEETAYARQIAQHAGVPGFTGDFDTRIVSADRTIKIDNGSTDLADVSQVVPTINMFAACFAANTPMHTWAVTAQACRPSAHRGMRFAAASLALAGARLASDPESLAAVRAEFEKER